MALSLAVVKSKVLIFLTVIMIVCCLYLTKQHKYSLWKSAVSKCTQLPLDKLPPCSTLMFTFPSYFVFEAKYFTQHFAVPFGVQPYIIACSKERYGALTAL